MGPGFMNLRFMCHCLARAIKRHIDFGKGEHWFLQDLQAESDDIDLEFSYQLPPNLKLTLNPKGVRVSGSRDLDHDDDDINPFQRESPQKDIDTLKIEVEASEVMKMEHKNGLLPVDDYSASYHDFGKKSLAEPEPESIKSSADSNSKKVVVPATNNN